MQGDNDKLGSQTDIDIYMVSVPRTSEKSISLGSNNSESSFGHMVPYRFYAKVTYDEYTSEFRYLSTGGVVQFWDKRNIIFHKVTKECYMFHKTVGHLVTVCIETCPAETTSVFCRDKVIKQHKSQLYPELTKMSRSEVMRPTLPSSSMISMTKPYSDMYTHHHFTELEQEHLNFLQDQPRPKVVDRNTLWSFTDTGYKQKSNYQKEKCAQYSKTVPFHWRTGE